MGSAPRLCNKGMSLAGPIKANRMSRASAPAKPILTGAEGPASQQPFYKYLLPSNDRSAATNKRLVILSAAQRSRKICGCPSDVAQRQKELLPDCR